MTNTGSERFKLNSEDLKKVGKGALIAIAGALLTYGSTVVTDFNFGTYAPLVTAVWSVLANIGWKWVRNNQK